MSAPQDALVRHGELLHSVPDVDLGLETEWLRSRVRHRGDPGVSGRAEVERHPVWLLVVEGAEHPLARLIFRRSWQKRYLHQKVDRGVTRDPGILGESAWAVDAPGRCFADH